MDKTVTSATEAVRVVRDAMMVATGGFGICGIPAVLLAALADHGSRDLTVVSNNCGAAGIGNSLLLENGGQLFFGAEPRVPMWTPTVQSITVGGVSFSAMPFVTLSLAIGLMLGLQFIIFRTKIGLAMRAVSHNHQTAALMGVPTDNVISFTFMLGSALAAAAGLLYSLSYPKIEPFMGLLPGLKAFVAAVLGGIGDVQGAMVGGLVLGLGEEFVAGYVSSGLRDALAFGLLIAVLLFKPSGLFGSTAAEKV